MKIRILMIGPHRNVKGGISSVVNVYYYSPLIEKYDVYYLASHVDGSKFTKTLQFFKSLIIFSWDMVMHNTSLIHIHMASQASFYRKSIFVLLGHIFRKKILLHIHGAEFEGFYNNSIKSIKWYIRKIFQYSDTIIALSGKWKDVLNKIAVNADKVQILYNPVVIPEWKNKSQSSLVKILFMGRLGKRKGTYDLIEAAIRIAAETNHFCILLCGDGETEEIKNLINEKKISSLVKVLGWIKNKEDLFRESDIYVLPSYHEGIPMSILEAASYGLPIVSTRVGGIDEIVENGENGFLSLPGDIDSLKTHLKNLIDSKELRLVMGRKAYQGILNKFDIKIIEKQLDQLYMKILNNEY